MANEQFINQVVDRAAIEGDIDFLERSVQDAVNMIADAKQKIASVSSAKNFKEFKSAQDALLKSINSVSGASEKVIKLAERESKVRLNNAKAADLEAKAVEKLSRAKLNEEKAAAINLRTKQAEEKASERKNKKTIDESNAYEVLKRQYKEVSEEAKRLSAQYGVGSDQAKAASASAKVLHDRLLEIEKAVGQNQRNVGNYAGSAKIIVDAMEAARKKIEQVNSSFGPTSPEAAKVRKEFEALEAITNNPRFLNIAANVGDTNKELKYFQQVLNQLEDSGQKNSTTYNEIRARLAQLTDQLGDTRAEIKALASDTRQFDLFAGAVNFAADAFQTAAGAAVLFGASEEDAAEATKVLVAVQSVSNGVKGIANELTTKGTAANIVYSRVQAVVALTTDASAKATTRLVAASKLLLGVGLIALVGFLVVKFIQLKNAISDTEREQKLFADVMAEANKTAGEQIGKLQALRKAAEDSNIPIKERKKAVDEIQEQYPEYFKNINDEIILQGKAATAYDKTRAAILENAKTRAIESELAKLATRELQIQFDNEDRARRKRDAQVVADLNKQRRRAAESKGAPASTGVSPEQFIAGDLAVNVINDQFAEANKELEQIAKDREFLLSKITASGVDDKDDKKKDDSAKKAKELADKELQTQFNILQLEFQRRADFNKQVADDDTMTLDIRLGALQRYLAAKTIIINAEAVLQKKLGEKTASELVLIEEQQADALIRIRREVSQQGSEILKNGVTDNLKVRTDLNEKIDKDAEALIKRFQERAEREAKIAADLLEKKKKLKDDEKKLYSELYNELGELATEFFTAQFDRKIAENEEEKARIDETTQQEINRVNQEVTNKEDAANQIRIIEAKAAADKQVLDNKSKESERRKAQIEKLGKAAEIIGSTAQGIASLSIKAAEARAQAALLASNPLTAAYAPVALANAGIISAQIPIVAAIGAAQIAKLVIPKYQQGAGVNGRPKHRGGFGEVGHGRVEVVKEPGKEPFLTPATPTIMPIAKDAIIYPSVDDYARYIHHTSIPQFMNTVTTDNRDMIAAIDRQGNRMIKAVKSLPQPVFMGEGRWDMHMKQGHSTREWLNKKL